MGKLISYIKKAVLRYQSLYIIFSFVIDIYTYKLQTYILLSCYIQEVRLIYEP